MKRILLIVGLLIMVVMTSKGQISMGGKPASLALNLSNDYLQSIHIVRPDIKPDQGRSEDLMKREQIGVSVKTSIDLLQDGSVYVTKKGFIYRLEISSDDACALGLYYDDFYLPQGARLFVYDPGHENIFGAFTRHNNRENRLFATEPVRGSSLIIDLYLPEGKEQDAFVHINEIAYFYKDINGFGDAGPCEVNVRCPEGDNWNNQINGIARIIVKDNGSQFWCSGSLVNNTNLDNKPYFLTANHCGKTSTPLDYSQWVFYFNYESSECTNPAQQPASKTMIGSSLRAKSKYGTSLGSDFKLLEITAAVPADYKPYFNGWSRSNVPSPSGVTIHHPQGDIKKISTYTETLVSTPYASQQEDPDEKYWKVVWAQTQSNHGVTEGGSSGAPLFNSEKKIVGALTGGTASCQNLEGHDYYGKFWYSWESESTDDAHRLAPWLDPQKSGVQSLPGMGYNQNVVVADFEALHDTVAVGSAADYTDISIGNPDKWEWHFEGGEPATSSEKNPSGILYQNIGRYDVKLIASNDMYTDTLLRKNMINVRPLVGPNPTRNTIEIYLGSNEVKLLEIMIYNKIGQNMMNARFMAVNEKVQIDLSALASDLYFVRIETQEAVSTHKVLLIK
ncbi:MAG: T9SS type A sorting domain-containing protein [Bacteroidales bacterium]|nr:T9SS type A sorting domain-containing protein [Bacteroidales bacterium]